MNPLPAGLGAYPAPCPGRTQVDAPAAYEQWSHNPNECSGNWPTTVYIEDSVKIPEHVEPGEYVLGWRWDCEETTQIWQSYAPLCDNWLSVLVRADCECVCVAMLTRQVLRCDYRMKLPGRLGSQTETALFLSCWQRATTEC